MCTYHRDDVSFLKLAVQSILDQDYGEVHLFLMVDGPHSLAALEYLDTMDNNKVTILRNHACRGLAVSLNSLIDHAFALNYDYFARMDADDICHPNRIREQVEYFALHPTVEVLGSWCYEINEHGERVGILQRPEDNADLRGKLPLISPFIHSSVMIGKRIFAHHRYPTDQYLSEDFAFWLELQKANAVFANLQKPLVEYRRSETFGRRRSQWRRIICEAKLRFLCLQLPGLCTPKNCLGVLIRIGAQCVLRISPQGFSARMFHLYRALTNRQVKSTDGLLE